MTSTTTYEPTRYARITTLDWQGQRLTRIIVVTKESDRFLSGYEVDREGHRMERNGAHQVHVIDKGAITKIVELRMALMYGWLEEIR